MPKSAAVCGQTIEWYEAFLIVAVKHFVILKISNTLIQIKLDFPKVLEKLLPYSFVFTCTCIQVTVKIIIPIFENKTVYRLSA